MAETIYGIRRTDGRLIAGEYAIAFTDDPDWAPAEQDADYADYGTEYEMLELSVKVIGRQTLPLCHDCDAPARHWGLCLTHAKEDDPEAFDGPDV
jgi:hypothetical protein